MLLIRLMTGFGRRITVSWNWHSKKKKKVIMPIKASKKKPTTELQKEKKKPGSSFRHKMRSSASANGLGVSGEQLSFANCPHCSRMVLSPPVQQFFPPTVSRSNVKSAPTISLVNCASERGHICTNGVGARRLHRADRTHYSRLGSIWAS